MLLHTSRGAAAGVVSHARQLAPAKLSAPTQRIAEPLSACQSTGLLAQGTAPTPTAMKPRRAARGRRQQPICSVLMEDKPAVADKFVRGSHWQVHKFGGTCMAAAERIRAAAELILKEPGECKVVVVSAMGSHPTSPAKVTDLILDMIRRAAKQDAAFLLDLAALQDKHVETAKLLLGQGPELTGFVSRLLDDIGNLKAMLQAMSIGACLQRTLHHRTCSTLAQRCRPPQGTSASTASIAHQAAARRARGLVCAGRSRYVYGGLFRLCGGSRRALERAALRAVLQAARSRRPVSARTTAHGTQRCHTSGT